MSKINQLKVGSLLSYAQMLLGVIISLLYTPIMLQLLGKSEYGLYNTVSSTISMLSLLNLGLSSGYIRYYSKYKKDNDYESIWRLNGLFLIIFSIIGLIALFCGLFLSLNLEIVFSNGLTDSEFRIAKILMMLLTVNLAISFPFGLFSHIISANEKFVFLKIVSIIKTVFSPLVTLPFLLMGFRSVAMVVVTLVFAIVSDLIYTYYVFEKLRYRFIFHDFEKGIFRSLFSYTAFIAINLIVDQINWNVDKILLGRIKGTEAVAVYSVGYTLYQYYMTFSTSISSVFTPKIHRIVNDTQDDKSKRKQMLTDLFIRVGRIQFILLGLVASGLVFFGKEFIVQYWAGSGYDDSYWVTLLLVIPASIALIQNIGIEIQRAQGKHKFRALVYALMAIFNVFISIILCPKYGVVGCALGTAISLIFANGIIINIYYHLRCNIDILRFWRNIFRLSLGMIVPIVFGIFIRIYISMTNIWVFLGCITLYSAVYCVSMWFLGTNASEKALFLVPLKKLLKK